MATWVCIRGMWKMLKIKNGEFLETIRVYILAIKYFIGGDKWKFAKEYAEAIVKGFKRK